MVSLLYVLFFVQMTMVSAEIISLEWSLGSPLPVSKVIDSGTEQYLYCSVKDTAQQHSVLLQCPALNSICMENCIPNDDSLHISCENLSTDNMLVFRYKILVFKTYEGLWKCQYKAATSRAVQLTVSNKPYISSFTAIPNPVWKGSQLNVTCQAAPLHEINGIQLYRRSNDNVTAVIQSESNDQRSQYSNSVIIRSVHNDRDENIECMVFTDTGMISTKLIKINIFYFPDKLQLTLSSSDRSFTEGSQLSFQCTSEGGNPKPVLHLYRQRQQRDEDKLSNTKILITKLDNKAKFYCKMEKIAGVTSRKKSNEISITVKYPPDNIELTEEPAGQIIESQVQNFICLSHGAGSEPPSQIEWSMHDYFGRKIPSHELEGIIERVNSFNSTSNIVKDSIRIVILRNYNGRTISCTIIYDQKRLFTQKKLIKVAFAPNTITLNSNPLGPIMQGSSMTLTCTTGTANPTSKIQWSQTKPGKKTQDITSHSNMDLIPSNYSGVAISSSLNMHGVKKSDHGILFRCIVSHAYITTETVKEYLLNVLFAPIIQVFSYPHSIEEGEQVFLQCRTSGGNPNNASLYRFQWKFCPVNNTYQIASDSDLSLRPTSDIRKYCSSNGNGLAFQKSPALNLTSVSGKQRGWYSCFVHSPGGTETGYTFLNVLYPPILLKQTPERVYRKTSSDVALKFEVLSNPPDIDVKWFFRPLPKLLPESMHGQPYETKAQQMPQTKKEIVMKPFGRVESIIFENYTVYLLIRSISYSDYGYYYCDVGNRVGKKSIQFQLFPTNDISIPESSVSMQFNGRTVIVHYEPPSQGHFTHLILRICSQEGLGDCKDMHISNPLSGKATTTVQRSPSSFSYRIIVYNGSSLLQITNPIQKQYVQTGNWVEMSFEMMIAVIFGVIGIFILLFAALMFVVLLKCRQNKYKEDLFVENNSILTANSHRRQDYFLLNSSANTTLLKNGCHCFPNYPLELRSDNGSDHSAPSQDTRLYHPIIMRRKVRDNGEMISIHSGSSFQNPDVVMTDKTSLVSGNTQTFNDTPQFSSHGCGTPNKVSFLSGRLHSFDGQRQDLSLTKEFAMPQNMVFAAVDDGTNQTRLIPIATKNVHSEYPLYFQMNSQGAQKQYDTNPSPIYSLSLPRCIKPCQNDNYRENSSSTNTDSNQYSVAQDPSRDETPSDANIDTRKTEEIH